MFAEDVAPSDYYFYQSRCNCGKQLCFRNILHLSLRFYSILSESRDLLGFYCRDSTVYNIMLLALILILNFSCPLSKENAVGVSFQSHTECETTSFISGYTKKRAWKVGVSEKSQLACRCWCGNHDRMMFWKGAVKEYVAIGNIDFLLLLVALSWKRDN